MMAYLLLFVVLELLDLLGLLAGSAFPLLALAPLVFLTMSY